MRRLTVAVAVFTLQSCAPSESIDPVPRAVPPLTPLTDINPDPDIVEVLLVAEPAVLDLIPGQPANVWAYRDGSDSAARPTVPGPMILAKQGDRIIVHFDNQLEEGSTVHFHGLRLPVMMDGAHPIVLPGSRFDYEFIAKDAGLFWYHPHFHTDVQIERGLYGAFLVREQAGSIPEGERILVLDDVKLDDNGLIQDEWTDDDIQMGRRGNVVTVNGAPAVDERPSGSHHDTAIQPLALSVSAGSRERWRLVNAASGRFFNLRLQDRPIQVIGWDGGLLEQSYQVDTLLIAPGERYDVLVHLPDAIDDTLALQMIPHDTGHGQMSKESPTLLQVQITRSARVDAGIDKSAPIPKLPIDGTTPIRSLVLTEDPDGPYGPQYFINGEVWPFNTALKATLGNTEIWQIQNETEGDHPFHLHGMFFQVLSRGERAEEHLGWKDTVSIPGQSTLRFSVRYEEPGRWMYHCQIPEHAERGMMGEVDVF